MSDRERSKIIIGTPVVEFEPRPPRSRTYRPDTAVDGWSTGRFVVRAASVRGYQHRHDGTPRQDDFALAWHSGSGALVIAVADGVSSVELAHVGATLVCRTAVEQLLQWLDTADGQGTPDWENVLRCASWALVEFASAQPAAGPDEPPAVRAERLLATTLVAAVLRAGPDGSAIVELARAGDSSAWLVNGESWTEIFLGDGSEANGDGMVATATAALPRVPAGLSGTTTRLAPGAVLLVGTDGVGGPLGDGRGQVGAALADGVAVPPAPLDFAHLLDFSRETFDDDRTLVAVWPEDGEGGQG